MNYSTIEIGHATIIKDNRNGNITGRRENSDMFVGDIANMMFSRIKELEREIDKLKIIHHKFESLTDNE